MFGWLKPSSNGLSPHLKQTWGYVRVRHLILATPDFIVFLDEELDVDWKSSPAWDAAHKDQRRHLDEILNRAAELETGDWDRSNWETTLSLKRQIGEAVARGLSGSIAQAKQMLDVAESYRDEAIGNHRRSRAIADQVRIKDEWRGYYKRWTAIHYMIGIGALILSTLVASRPTWIGASEQLIGSFAWLAAVFTGLLTFLTPEKKAGKYSRAWSTLNSEITRYNADESYTVNDVLDAYNKGENIILETTETSKRR